MVDVAEDDDTLNMMALRCGVGLTCSKAKSS